MSDSSKYQAKKSRRIVVFQKIKIDELPVEVLMKIFSYLTSYGNVSLVNKHFYDVACKVNDSKICLTLNPQLFNEENLSILQSIQRTNRKISKMSVIFISPPPEYQYRSTVSIIKKFSSTVKYFEFAGHYLAMHDIIKIMSLPTNAEHLVVNCWVFQKNLPIMSSSADLNLHQLKKLEVGGELDEECLVVFKRLPVGVLTELRLLKDKLDSYNRLKRESPVTIEKISTNVAKILSKQSTLKYLTLNMNITADVMDVVNQLTNLERLSIEFFDSKVQVLMDFKKLKKLKDLTLRRVSLENLTCFAKLNNASITIFDVESAFDLTSELIHATAKSVPYLKVLRWRNFQCNNMHEACNSIMKNFNFVEDLQVGDGCTHTDNNVSASVDGDCFNEKLIALDITSTLPYDTPFVYKLIADYPNLEKLKIYSTASFTASCFRLIFNGFTKLESVTLYQDKSELTTDDFQFLKHGKNNLKFILLCGLDDTVIGEVVRSDLFEVVKIKQIVVNCCYLYMAVDQYTMDRELE